MIQSPPRQVPQNKLPAEYCKLSIQYYLMGWTPQAVKAGRLALAGNKDEMTGTPFQDLNPEDYERFRVMIDSLDRSVSFGEGLFGFTRSLSQSIQEGLEATSLLADELVRDNKTMRVFKYGLEYSFTELSKMAGDAVSKIAENAVKVTRPPRDVPETLSATGYIRIGLEYLGLGWTEQARDSFEKARDIDRDGILAARANSLIAARLPLEPVPFLASEKMIEARRKMLIGNADEAVDSLEKLLETYPEFEWTHCELADALVKRGHLERASTLVFKALAINSKYFDAWMLKAKIDAIAGSIIDAQRSLDTATMLDAEDTDLPHLRQFVSILSRL